MDTKNPNAWDITAVYISREFELGAGSSNQAQEPEHGL